MNHHPQPPASSIPDVIPLPSSALKPSDSGWPTDEIGLPEADGSSGLLLLEARE